MNKYWRGITKDDKFVTEAQGVQWNDIVTELKSLELVTENGTIKLPDNMKYIQAKTASAELGSGHVTIESRYIGFCLKDEKIIVRVNEKTGNIGIEIQSI
jgi:hypothetical protein